MEQKKQQHLWKHLQERQRGGAESLVQGVESRVHRAGSLVKGEESRTPETGHRSHRTADAPPGRQRTTDHTGELIHSESSFELISLVINI